jgi:ubiquinone/menaquinone biosynthesis C-methylase UbiE
MTQHHRIGDMRFYKALMCAAQEHYKNYALGYRERDDDVECPMHKDLGDILARVSDSFKHPISVLDLGCGTGRYFHCLQSTERIIGVDASPDMLAQARHPVWASKITASVDLICANIFELPLSSK